MCKISSPTPRSNSKGAGWLAGWLACRQVDKMEVKFKIFKAMYIIYNIQSSALLCQDMAFLTLFQLNTIARLFYKVLNLAKPYDFALIPFTFLKLVCTCMHIAMYLYTKSL